MSNNLIQISGGTKKETVALFRGIRPPRLEASFQAMFEAANSARERSLITATKNSLFAGWPKNQKGAKLSVAHLAAMQDNELRLNIRSRRGMGPKGIAVIETAIFDTLKKRT